MPQRLIVKVLDENSNIEKISALLKNFPDKSKTYFLYFMLGVLEDTINNLPSDSAEIKTLLTELQRKTVIGVQP